jgi:hypothetical protein
MKFAKDGQELQQEGVTTGDRGVTESFFMLRCDWIAAPRPMKMIERRPLSCPSAAFHLGTRKLPPAWQETARLGYGVLFS